ncbi:MAG: methyl-accepting chemotaxis protein [Burkholderiaceae bacterium]
MLKWTVGKKIAASFGLTVLVFIAVSVISYRGTAQLIEASELRRHTHESLNALTDTRMSLRAVGLAFRTYLLSGEDAHREALRSAEQELRAPLQALLKSVMGTPSQVQRINRIDDLLDEYLAAINGIAEVRRTKGHEAAVQLFLADQTRQLLAQIGRILAELQSEQDAALERRTARAADESRLAQQTIVFGSLVAIILAIVGGVLLSRNISAPLRQLTATAERVAGGDLGDVVSMGSRHDEIGILGQALARMTESLRTIARTAELVAAGDLRAAGQSPSKTDVLGNALAKMAAALRAQIRQLIDGATVLSAAAAEIVASSSQLAVSAAQSAAAVRETSATVEEVRQTTHLASQKARDVSDGAQQVVAVSESGRRSMQDVAAGMARIRRQMEVIAAGMAQLSQQNYAVGQIIATVEDIATQSNLLAVNAAIEAAKAGEHGKGFAVVAQEVKSLAEQSRQATSQVRTILGEIQKANTAAVMATEEGTKVVESGAKQASVADNAIQALADSVGEAAQAALQIAASSQQQLVGVDQVAGAMESIRQASGQNAASAKQLEDTARSLGELGRRLKQTVERYKV